jgi:hypothetical protein
MTGYIEYYVMVYVEEQEEVVVIYTVHHFLIYNSIITFARRSLNQQTSIPKYK